MNSVSGDTPPYSTCFVLMGVSGSGKSIIGESLANRLKVQFIDGDNLHPKSNIEKMSAKIPLTDEDRRPWLEQIQRLIHQWNVDNVTGVVVCSALKKKYRDVIRSKSHKRTEDSIRRSDDEDRQADDFTRLADDSNRREIASSGTDNDDKLRVDCDTGSSRVRFIYLKADFNIILQRLQNRAGHFMPTDLLQSQFQTLEEPDVNIETDVTTVKVDRPLEDVVDECCRIVIKEMDCQGG